MNHCLSDQDLVDLSDESLPDERRRALTSHADGCAICRRVIAEIGRTLDTAPPTGAPFVAVRIGRYALEQVVGVGASGVVYAALDPELGRRVALKLLRANGPGAQAREQRRVAMRAEAQAMARLSHPNVVPIHDIGLSGEQLFAVMELVEGATLESWLRERPRGWREIRDVMVGAGRGLAAAHSAGVLHRDFKPGNVLLGEDGRVRVADFGLARAGGTSGPVPPGVEIDTLTRSGQLVGTPAYLAPEVLRGERHTEASDQFSFCVSLHEALAGARPFSGRNVGALLASIESGPPPGPLDCPRWLERAIHRGLAADPAARFPSIDALLAAITPDEGAPRAKLAAWSAVAVVAILATLIVLDRREAQQSRRVCQAAAQELAGVWDAPRRAALGASFEKSAGPSAAALHASVERLVDDFAGAWVKAHVATCEATRVHGHQPEAVLERRMRCLGEQRGLLRAVVDVLSEGDRKVLGRAVEAASALPRPSRCAAESVARPRRAPAPRAPTDAIQARYERAAATFVAGRYTEVESMSLAIAADARAAGDVALEARAYMTLGEALYQLRRIDEAERALGDALRLAVVADDDWVAARSMLGTLYVSAILRNDFKAGVRLVEQAAPVVERAGDEVLQARLAYFEGVVRAELGEHGRARSLFEKSLALWQRATTENFNVSIVITALGKLERMAGRIEEAGRFKRQSLDLHEKVFGEDHPGTGVALFNLANHYAIDLADYAGAIALYRRALRARIPGTGEYGNTLATLARTRQRLGDGTDFVEQAREGLAIAEKSGDKRASAAAMVEAGLMFLAAGDRAGAIAILRRAVAVREELRGPKHAEVAEARSALARALCTANPAEADALARGALEFSETVLGPDHPSTAREQLTRCMTAGALGKPDEARPLCARALQLLRGFYGESHPDVAEALLALGENELAAGNAAEAAPALEQARAILATRAGDAWLRAEIDRALARARAPSARR